MGKITLPKIFKNCLVLFLIFSGTYLSASNEYAAPAITVDSAVNVSCNGASDGSISISISGGATPYSYSWSGPGSYSSTNQDISNLAPGTYTITVTDSNNDPAVKEINLVVEDNLDPTITAPSKVNVNNDPGACSASGVTLGNPTTSDNCGVKQV
ncbi:hypothetical protein ACFQ3Q_05100, partial [Salegentibacter chungangensis]